MLAGRVSILIIFVLIIEFVAEFVCATTSFDLFGFREPLRLEESSLRIIASSVCETLNSVRRLEERLSVICWCQTEFTLVSKLH